MLNSNGKYELTMPRITDTPGEMKLGGQAVISQHLSY